MKWIDWDEMKKGLNVMFKPPEKDSYLPKLIENLEQQKEEDNSLPFKILDIKEKGFIVKVGGLYAYISFFHMPWQYAHSELWKVVFPFIKEKVFFCKIHRISKYPLSILVDGGIPQFRTAVLMEDEKYEGVVLKKTSDYLCVDIGFDFAWRFGSLPGICYKDDFEKVEMFNDQKIGEVVKLCFLGYSNNKQIILGNSSNDKDWYTGVLDDLLGTVCSVKVIKSPDAGLHFLYDDQYVASLPVTSLIYKENTSRINHAIKNLKHGDVLHCKVEKVDRTKKVLRLKWETFSEIEGIISRNIFPKKDHLIRTENAQLRSRLDEATLNKLGFVGKSVHVEVVKKQDVKGRIRTTYRIGGVYHGKMIVANECYRITEKEKKQIEQNLQEGDILTGEVVHVEGQLITFRWNITEDELMRFCYY